MHRGIRHQAVQTFIQLSLSDELKREYIPQLLEFIEQPLYEKKIDILDLLIHVLPQTSELVQHMVPL
ncbi:hypothetical protein HMI55_004814 [Coelomomyces lativittatus]|nr:hypothetical protein HMI55_004814 [Coelomomyces lativittatus]